TYACVEGPRLGTRAESLFLRAAGADVVGMTNVPEAFLALEAQLGYCTIAVATDYDSWLEDPAQHASAEQILQLFHANLERVQQRAGVDTHAPILLDHHLAVRAHELAPRGFGVIAPHAVLRHRRHGRVRAGRAEVRERHDVQILRQLVRAHQPPVGVLDLGAA